jgi:hypothetical protein
LICVAQVGNEGTDDDYDRSELVNMLAQHSASPGLLDQMRTLLEKGFPQPPYS